MSRPRPTTPPTTPPTIADVLFEGLFDPTGAVVAVWDDVVKGEGEVEEGVDTPVFPTVDSSNPWATISLAPASSNWSGLTTSMYAHAGTAVAELI